MNFADGVVAQIASDGGGRGKIGMPPFYQERILRGIARLGVKLGSFMRRFPAFAFCVAALVLPSFAVAQERLRDQIYLKEGGAAFTLDVFKPKNPNGGAVIWFVSGGWVSRHDDINETLALALNQTGLTVVQVVHGSQPRYIISDIVKQVRRAVRFVRTNAASYGIDEKRIAVSGASAGGHLSLMVAGLGDDGNPNAKDPVERASSRVAAAAVFFPPTDFLNYGVQGNMPADGSDPKMAPFLPAFGPLKGLTPAELKAKAAELSPITNVKKGFPAVLLSHGDKDGLVPLQQSEEFDKAVGEVGSAHQLIVIPGGGHDPSTVIPGLPRMVAWLIQQIGRSK